MTENEEAKRSLLLNIKRLEGMLERIDSFCQNYDQEKISVGVDIIDNISEILKEIDVLEINQSTEYSISKELTEGYTN